MAVTHQSQMRIVKRSPDGSILRTVDKDGRIDLAGFQCTQRSLVAQGQHCHVFGREVIKGEHGFGK